MGWPEGAARSHEQVREEKRVVEGWAGGIIACPFDAQVPYITKDFSVSGSTRKEKSTLHHVDEEQVMDG